MATLSKAISGFILEDKFDSSNLLWDISPNDYSRVVYESGFVGLEHGEERLIMSIPTPSKDYVMQAYIYHFPKSLSDIGGIVVLSNTGNQIEYQNFFNGTIDSSIYRYIKVVVEKEVYNFYASEDGKTWIDVGNSQMTDGNRIGFFIDGILTVKSEKFVILEAEFYKSNFITINNIPKNGSIKIYNNSGINILEDNDFNVKIEDNKAIVDFTKAVLPMRNYSISVFSPDGTLFSSLKDIDINGGDVYECNYDIEISIAGEGTIINSDNIFDLGRVHGGDTVIPLIITNKEKTTLNDLKMSIITVDYYRGGEFVKLSLDGSDEYNNSIKISNLPPNTGINVNVKIERDLSQFTPAISDSYRFKIVIE